MGWKAALSMLGLISVLCPSIANGQKPLQEVYDQTRKCVVLLVTFDDLGNAQSIGSGVILAPDGEIVTSFHVVRQAKTIAAKLWNGSFLPITEVVGIDEKVDLVVLKADAQDLPRAQVAPEKRLSVGDSVIAIGNPLGLESTLSTGVVSGFRDVPQLGRTIQTTAAISPGSSGGGLFDFQGRLVGITSSTLIDGQNLNFAIPVEAINRVKRFPAQKLASIQQPIGAPQGERGQSVSGADSLNRAKAFMFLEMFDDAEKELASALAENKFNPEVHFYLGELLFQRKNYDKAREEFKIALNLDPASVTPLVRLAAVNMVLLGQKEDNEFRAEAIRYLRQIKRMKGQTRKDRYSDEVTLTKITADLDTHQVLTRLLRITGEWVTPEGAVWKFTETDGPLGKRVLPNTQLVTGSIAIVQAYGPTPLTVGFMWRNSELELEGWYGKALPGVECNFSLFLRLQQSEDGIRLSGFSKPMPPSKPPKGCTYPDTTHPIELRRK